MAYGNQQRSQGGFVRSGSAASNRPAAAAGAREFVEDPNELGIGYQKESEKAGTYITFTLKKDVPAGTKVTVYENRVKNRTEKTPTHRLKAMPARA